eukprot:NODE_663_length_4918_cov_0.396140.p5 type:complete len:123 gc:universal NODE_663_length_4918_cov_0.396140:1444-1812(+)
MMLCTNTNVILTNLVTIDPILSAQLAILYDRLLTSNLLKIIEPYSRVQLSHLSGLLNLPMEQVEHQLSQMILDGVLKGILDQQTGVLVVFNEEELEYTSSMDHLKKMEVVVDSLFEKLGQVA